LLPLRSLRYEVKRGKLVAASIYSLKASEAPPSNYGASGPSARPLAQGGKE